MNYEYNIRTDLAIQNKNLKKINTYKYKDLTIKKFYKRKFNFTNILFNNIELDFNKNNLKEAISKELKQYLKKYNIKKDAKALVVGLGNKNIISDSIGVRSVSKVLATAYINEIINMQKRAVYTFAPGVYKDTGFMAFKAIKALVRELKIDFVIIIDSLISNSGNYLNKLVQISDIGITPGSGIANYQEEISLKTLKIPVFVIGVPTAIEASTIIKDALDIDDDKVKFKEGYDLIVSKKDIDIFAHDISNIIGDSINTTLN